MITAEILSLPGRRARALLLEGVNDSAVELFSNSEYLSVQRIPTALEAGALREAIRGIDLLGIRSRTQLTHDVFSDADRLIAVGCFSVGTNQVDLDAARKCGVPVFNAPFSNTRSVAELVIGKSSCCFDAYFHARRRPTKEDGINPRQVAARCEVVHSEL
jgi:D-3-phosphoglycerate dehydrogenase / 2-oxoglutarate reductase